MRHIALKLLVMFIGILFANMAFADDEIISRSYFLDTSSDMSLEQVEKQPFKPYDNVLTGGFQTGTYWLKLKLRPSHQDLVLRIRPLFTEEIELFDPLSQEIKPLVGAKHAWNASELQGASYTFVLMPSSNVRDVYLRVKSSRTYLIYADALPKAQYLDSNYIQQLLYSGYSTFTLILALWLFVTWLMNREIVLGIFTIQQLLAFLHTSFHTGFIRPLTDSYVSPASANAFFSLTVVIYPLVSIVANKLLLQEYGLRKVYKGMFNGLLLCSALVVLLYAAGSSIAFKLNNFLVLIAVFYYAFASLFGTDMNQAGFKASALPINMLRAFYTINCVLWVFTILPYLGLIPAGEIALHTVFVYGLMSGLIFFFLLQYRSKSLLKIETAKATALQAEAEQERKQREEQGMLMAMLSHEIKTPLSILKLVVDEKVAGSDLEGHANRAVNNIDLIVERCLQLGKLDAEAIRLNPQQIELAVFLKQIVADMKASDRVDIDCDPDLSTQVDSSLLRIVISNLLENAVKYSPSGSSILMRARSYRQNGMPRLEVSVANQAGVLGTPDPEHVFKKYYRNASATKISGTGLGLYLVKELVGVLGGEVMYEAQDTRVVFKVAIPS